MERYHVVSEKGEILGFVATSNDFTALFDRKGRIAKLYLWLSSSTAIGVDGLVRGRALRVDGAEIDVVRALEDIPWPVIYSSKSLEEYVEWVQVQVWDAIRGKSVMVNFSGGKDSMSVLAVLTELRRRVDFELYAVYTHVPFLELRRSIGFVERVSRKLGVDIEILEGDRRLMEKRLVEDGLPFRGWRWCTYMKLKPIKLLRKRLRPDIVADGDRLAETFKRFRRLYGMSPKRPRILSGSRIKPVYVWTVLDVVRTVRETGCVHPDYIEGQPRVACMLCPYKSLHEIPPDFIDRVEDPGVIESALKTSYSRRYEDLGIPWEDFLEQHLWRMHPEAARTYWSVRRALKRMVLEQVEADYVNTLFTTMWRSPMPRAPVVGPEEAFRRIAEFVVQGLDTMIAAEGLEELVAGIGE